MIAVWSAFSVASAQLVDEVQKRECTLWSQCLIYAVEKRWQCFPHQRERRRRRSQRKSSLMRRSEESSLQESAREPSEKKSWRREMKRKRELMKKKTETCELTADLSKTSQLCKIKQVQEERCQEAWLTKLICCWRTFKMSFCTLIRLFSWLRIRRLMFTVNFSLTDSSHCLSTHW